MDFERSARVLLSLTIFYYTMLKIEFLFVVGVSRNITFAITSIYCLTLFNYILNTGYEFVSVVFVQSAIIYRVLLKVVQIF
jgi:hypothetical protein